MYSLAVFFTYKLAYILATRPEFGFRGNQAVKTCRRSRVLRPRIYWFSFFSRRLALNQRVPSDSEVNARIFDQRKCDLMKNHNQTGYFPIRVPVHCYRHLVNVSKKPYGSTKKTFQSDINQGQEVCRHNIRDDLHSSV